MTYEEQYARYRQMTEETLDALLSDGAFARIPSKLLQSMRYSALAGGKRIRPVLLLATTEMLSGPLDEARVPAAALEMIHTYSLIHDDLPGMDDDDYRRGRLTNHKVFGVGPAILAGDALLNGAYECLIGNALRYPAHLPRHVQAIAAIAGRAGVGGMIAGQSIDLESEGKEPELATLRYIHEHKTADLLTAPLEAAAAISGADDGKREALRRFGYAVGVAFQIDDDILDIVGDAAQMGKATGMDAARGKMTWPALAGLEQAKAESAALWQEAEEVLSVFSDKAGFLRDFADHMTKRKN